jgi:hypothetical protein
MAIIAALVDHAQLEQNKKHEHRDKLVAEYETKRRIVKKVGSTNLYLHVETH